MTSRDRMEGERSMAPETEERTIQTRWSDFDVNGHLTDTSYPVFFAEARADLIGERIGQDATFPVVSQQLDFRSEVTFPTRTVVVRTAVASLGRSSVTFEQELIRPDGEIAAVGRAVLVAWDPDHRGSRELTDFERRAFGQGTLTQSEPRPAVGGEKEEEGEDVTAAH